MLSQGPKNPGDAGSDASVGTAVWTNPTNIFTSNDVRATSSPTGAETTQYVYGITFGFSIPKTAIIRGIEVTIERERDGAGTNTTVDNIVKLMKAGVISGNNNASGSTWPTSDGVAIYGSSSDLWGLTWTPADINAVNFGVALSAKNTAGAGAKTIGVDTMTIKVYYELTDAGGII